MLLQTPYGITRTSFVALHPDWKYVGKYKLSKANAQHYRVQADETRMSIGEAIRRWFGVPKSKDFETIEIEVAFHNDEIILIPTAATMRKKTKTGDAPCHTRILENVVNPLSIHHDYQSKFWMNQIAACRKIFISDVAWAGAQIRRVVNSHRGTGTMYISEADLLRTAGALSILGVDLGPSLTKGYDCPLSEFNFLGYPPYACPVEIKKRSARFDYQIMNYTKLPRAVVLCIDHDLKNPPGHVDVIELSTLADCLKAE